MVEYQTAKDNVDRILGITPPKKNRKKIENPIADQKNPIPGRMSWYGIFFGQAAFLSKNVAICRVLW